MGILRTVTLPPIAAGVHKIGIKVWFTDTLSPIETLRADVEQGMQNFKKAQETDGKKSFNPPELLTFLASALRTVQKIEVQDSRGFGYEYTR